VIDMYSFLLIHYLLFVSGKASGWIGSIIASLSNGVVTDKTWKCTTSLENGWNMRNFDEFGWTSAVEHETNSHTSVVLPYGEKTDIAADAKFIWTTDNYEEKEIYCRKTLVTSCNESKDHCRV